jgi:hypothetical protein
VNRVHPLDRGPDYVASETAGVIDTEPPRIGPASYNILVPQVDADGNDVAGIRNVYVQVPIGTYTGWNLFRKELYEDGFCTLSGSFVAFVPSRADREAAGDPRPSLQERYPTKEVYVEAVRKAAASLVAQRFLLDEDARRLVEEAEREGVRAGP